MLAAERQARIAEEVRRRGAARVSEFADMFGVSDMTIRRDLDILAQQGVLAKVHGGATRRTPSTDEPGFEAKSLRQQREKEAIAAAAAELVQAGAAVGLSAGTTTWTLAGLLRDVPRLTVVTNSIRVADTFEPRADLEQTVLLTGGVRTPSDAMVGPVAVRTLSEVHLDLVFLGVHGMDDDAGFTTPNLLESDTDRAFIAAAGTLVVVADHTKWGEVGISTIAPLDAADTLISDDGLSDEARAAMSEHVGELHLAAVTASPSSRHWPQRQRQPLAYSFDMRWALQTNGT